MSKSEIYLSALAIIALASASTCPESRKPHPTSCTIFYNCINLPGGGYVWAPAKCINGLVFQPYLRICVLPGDSWTCDILATEAPDTTTTKVSELIDSTQTSYLGYNEDGSAGFSEPMDYYKVDKYTDAGEVAQQTVTPYPLIEVTQPNNYVNQIDSTIKNLGVPIAVKHSEDNYLYHFVNGQQVLATPPNANNEQLQAHLERLTQLIEKLVAYQGFGLPQDRQPPTTVTTSTTSRLPARYSVDYNNNYKESSNENEDSAALNFLIRNYVLKSQAQVTNSIPDRGIIRNENADEQEPTTSATNDFDAAINGAQGADHIVLVKDGLNNRQYFTIHQYKIIANQLTTERVELLPCTIGVRLHNSTDCTKYYSCDPATAKIRQYSCPSNTAFNKHKRLCEREEYVRCVTEASENNQKNSYLGITARNKADESGDSNPCETVGKHGDLTSDVHYYLCYSDNGKSGVLKSRRMECPNHLVFCQGKNVCTTRKRCETL